MDRLRECQRQGLPGVPRGELLRYFGHAAEGLDFLNEPRHVLAEGAQPVGIQHGDVKPQNLLLVGSACKVGDFGLLRRLAAGVSSQSTTNLTAAYAPPESFEGRSAPSSDQYSLAVAWCQLRGGRLPFEGGPAQLLAGHMLKPPDLSMLPPSERSAAARALSKKPQERWPTCRAFVEALGRAAPMAAPASARRAEEVGPTTPGTSEQTGPPRLAPTAAPQPIGPTAPVRTSRSGWGMVLTLVALLLLSAGVVLASIWLLGPRGQPGKGTDDSRANRDHDGASRDKDRAPPDGNAKTKDTTPPPPRKPAPEFTNAVGIKLIWIEPGSPGKPRSFLMGSPDGNAPPGVPKEEGRSDDEAPHQVTLTRGYYMAATLVTQWQWEQVLGKDANHSEFRGKSDAKKKTLPVDNISWNDCQKFCRKLSALDGKKYALPTEAEWEYACRAGTSTPFWFGASVTDRDANYDARFAYGKDGKEGVFRWKPTPVEQFKPNPWGLHDMHGNLWQWCEDCYAADWGRDATDPVNLTQGDAGVRVARGGSWSSNPGLCRAACRARYVPTVRQDSYGCRVVCRPD
jgi:formylglycine-generating enzyme required for sulfatase activity